MNISVVIVVCDSKMYLQRCLNSLFSPRIRRFEVILVDNSFSKDVSSAASLYPEIVFIRNKENRGAAFARNQGIRAAKGDYVMFLDSDAYLKEDFFEKLEKILKTLPEGMGAVSPKIIKTGLEKVFSCGLKVSSIYRVLDVGRNEPSKNYSHSFTVDGPNSCCAVYKREVLEDIKEENYFDNDFFFLFEDADLALRLKKKGYKCLFTPELVCYHYGGGSGVPREYRQFLCFRNRIFMILKYNKGLSLLSFFLRGFFYDLARAIYFALTNRYFFRAIRQVMRYKRNLSRNN